MSANRSGSTMAWLLTAYFGPRWPLVVFAICLALLWPVYAFWPEIRFDPGKFTQAWLTIGVNCTGIFLAVETIRMRRDAHEANETQRREFRDSVAKPRVRFLDAARKLLVIVRAPDRSQHLRQVRGDLQWNWSPLEEYMREARGFSTPDVDRARDIVQSLSQAEVPGDVVETEITELVDLVSRVPTKMEAD